MSKISDHVSDIPAKTRIAASRVRTGASNAWHRAAGNRIHGARIGLSNARNRRTIERGRAPRISGVRAAVSSRLPVYRNRINRAHGNPHQEDARLHRTGNEALARMKADRTPGGIRADRGRQAAARAQVRAGRGPEAPGQHRETLDENRARRGLRSTR